MMNIGENTASNYIALFPYYMHGLTGSYVATLWLTIIIQVNKSS